MDNIKDQLKAVNSHISELESYLILVNNTQFMGKDSKIVESMKNYFISVRSQLLEHMEMLAKAQLETKLSGESNENA
jgi:hypothetical protein